MARAAAGRFARPDSWRASSSFSSSRSTRRSSCSSASRLPSIQKFMVSQATKRGRATCWSTSSCSSGSMLARNTNGLSCHCGGNFGRNVWNTFSWVSSVVRWAKSAE
jgi:hypothetical protein